MRLMTVSGFIAFLAQGVEDSAWKLTDTLLISSDPEGNSYIGFSGNDIGVATDCTLIAGPPRGGYVTYSTGSVDDPANADTLIVFPSEEIYP